MTGIAWARIGEVLYEGRWETVAAWVGVTCPWGEGYAPNDGDPGPIADSLMGRIVERYLASKEA